MGIQFDHVMHCYDSLLKQAPFLADRYAFRPKVALILGSGLGALADKIDTVGTVMYEDISKFPKSTVSGHKGRFVFGYIEKTPVVIMQGRIHYYEGYAMEDVVLPVRLMRQMGAEILFLTNAAGGISQSLYPGALMLITDQISSFVPSPLIGPNEDAFGTRFPDMSKIYDEELSHIILTCAKSQSLDLKQGIYIQFTGPAYESPAEVRMAGLLGADACGMSTCCEAVVARHMGMRVCGISCITNMASGIARTPLCHEEVSQTADRISDRFQTLLEAAIMRMA